MLPALFLAVIATTAVLQAVALVVVLRRARAAEQRALERPNRLYCRRRARFDVLGTKNDAHAAATDLVEQPVGSCAGWTRSHP